MQKNGNHIFLFSQVIYIFFSMLRRHKSPVLNLTFIIHITAYGRTFLVKNVNCE